MVSSTFFGVLGILTYVITILWPARGRTERSPAMYHAAIVSCVLWVLYGDGFLMPINTVGFVLEFLSLTLFHLYNHRTFTNWMMHNTIVIIELACIYLLGLRALTFEDPIRFVGAICTAGNILVSVQEMMYQSRKSEPLYVENTLAAIANWFIWTIYAFVSSDTFILVSYLVGGFLGLVQFVIHYRADWRKIAEDIADLLKLKKD